jgi:probable phosphoglycerate mutase
VNAAGPSASVLHIHIDGGSRGNPGDAGFGVYVEDGRGEVVAELYGYLGRATNNVAEYQALLHALRFALGRRATAVRVFSDSELVVKQMNGQYKVKHPDMQTLHREARTLLAKIPDARIAHVRREQNRDADRLANEALDRKASKLD